MGKLKNQLEEYIQGGYYPFHMPGHKRNTDLMKMDNPYALDITEIDGFDNLHRPEELLKELQERAAALYGARESFLLVNGSTAGILIGMASAAFYGDEVIVARNCHRSVYHGIMVNQLRPVYIYPQYLEKMGISGPVTAENVDKTLVEHPKAKLVVITSPTYEGIVSDVKAIAQVVHKRGGILMVDEAHGAHFGFHVGFPENSIEKGADIVVHSLHKTLPAFTQTGLLHVNPERVSLKRVKDYFSVYQTSSPSYLLMAGIENCLDLLEESKELFDNWDTELTRFYKRAEGLKLIRVLQVEKNRKDPSKLVISVKKTSMTGAQLYDILRDRYRLQMEAEHIDYVIAMTGLGDREAGYERLILALEELDEELFQQSKAQGRLFENELKCCEEQDKDYMFRKGQQKVGYLPVFEMALTPYEAGRMCGKPIHLMAADGLISLEYAFLYPPGIPIIVPGERITQELYETIFLYKSSGLVIKGLEDEDADSIVAVAYDS